MSLSIEFIHTATGISMPLKTTNKETGASNFILKSGNKYNVSTANTGLHVSYMQFHILEKSMETVHD